MPTFPARLRTCLIMLVMASALARPAGLPLAAAAAAQSATPVPGLPRLDIAAMTLVPRDLPEPGYALEGGTRLSLNDEAAGVVAYRGGEAVAGSPTAFAARMSETGWLERYSSSLALPDAADPTLAARRVITYVTLYADTAGAATGFGLMEDESTVAAAADVPGARTIGEQSEITQDSGVVAGTDTPFQSLDLTFRTGVLTAGVLIYDNRGIAPEIAEVEALADGLLARIGIILETGGAGLGSRALRLDGTPGQIPFEDELYELRDDTIVPYFGETPGDLAIREVQYGVSTDVYTVYQALVTGDGAAADDPYVVIRLYRFPDAATAATWLGTLATDLREQTGQGDEYAEVTTLVGGLEGAEESVTLGYAYNASETLVTRGFMIALRAGPIVARIQVDGLPQPPIAAVQELAAAQARCLADPAGLGCVAAHPIPSALVPTPDVPMPMD